MPETVTITVATAMRRHPERAQGIPPLRTRSSSPNSDGRRPDWLAIRVMVHPDGGDAVAKASRRGCTAWSGGRSLLFRRPVAGAVSFRRSPSRVRSGDGAIVRLGGLLQTGGVVVARLCRPRSTGALGPQAPQQVPKLHWVEYGGCAG